MALNTSKYNHPMPLLFKGLRNKCRKLNRSVEIVKVKCVAMTTGGRNVSGNSRLSFTFGTFHIHVCVW